MLECCCAACCHTELLPPLSAGNTGPWYCKSISERSACTQKTTRAQREQNTCQFFTQHWQCLKDRGTLPPAYSYGRHSQDKSALGMTEDCFAEQGLLCETSMCQHTCCWSSKAGVMELKLDHPLQRTSTSLCGIASLLPLWRANKASACGDDVKCSQRCEGTSTRSCEHLCCTSTKAGIHTQLLMGT